MDAIYPVFARADRHFYEHPGRGPAPAGDVSFSVDVPASWRRADDGIWTYYEPEGASLPEQGWKVHLSVTHDDAEPLLRVVSRYCVREGLPFKHLSRASVLAASNGKDASREGSGKFVTIYPPTSALHRTLTELGRVTADYRGPHILSDLRWSEGPVFVRFGGFHRMFVEIDGIPTPAIRHPEGHLVADVRRPGFAPPEWVDIPSYLLPLVEQLGEVRPPEGFPRVTGVLHHSNAGGVYTAEDDGREVVLKEARPHAGVTADGLDAVARAEREAVTLRRLREPGIVALLRDFSALGHRYLVLERARGVPLHQAVVARHPLVSAGADAAAVADYREWALGLAQRLVRIVEQVHAGGFAHGDVHPGNFLVDDTGEVTLIDFEMARPAPENAPVAIGAPGLVAPDFADPAARAGTAADLFALRRLLLFLFAPLAPLLDLHPDVESRLQQWVTERFVLSDLDRRDLRFAETARPARPADDEPREQRIDALVRHLLADATPERTDRLWPGDPAQFDEPAYAVAHGALGTLLAVHAATGGVPEELERWCADAVRAAPPRSGLFDGLAGAAAAWETLGRPELADEALARCLDAPPRADAAGVYGGPAGTALGALRLAGRHPELVGEARRIFDDLADRARGWTVTASGPVATGAGGLLRGPSGAALLALTLFDLQGDRALLDLAEASIAADLARCVPTPDGSLQMNEGWRLLPYLGSGSAGVASALAALVARHPSSALASHLEALTLAAQPEFVLESGLFQGRAGLMLALAALKVHPRGAAPPSAGDVLGRHERLLGLHSIPRPVGVGYPGRALLRLSCDLATGSAGVLWTLASLRDRRRLSLPFLDLPPVAAAPSGARGPGGGDTNGIPALLADARAR
jgi:serine/threonine protein kinase